MDSGASRRRLAQVPQPCRECCGKGKVEREFRAGFTGWRKRLVRCTACRGTGLKK